MAEGVCSRVRFCCDRQNRRMVIQGWMMLTAMLIYISLNHFNYTTQWHHRHSVAELDKLMAERTGQVDHVCHKYNDTLLQQYAAWLGKKTRWSEVNVSLFANQDLLVDRLRRIAWCKVPKVASTSIVFGLLRGFGRGHLLGDRQSRLSRHIVLRSLMPKPALHEDISFCRAFMVVRHPFQRILSAYREKLLNRKEKNQFRKFRTWYGKSIIRYHRRQKQPTEYSDVPTFWEFVEYLIATHVWEYNQHWRPYYFTCTPCHHRYSVILHLENFTEEMKYLVRLTGLHWLSVKHDHVTEHKPLKSNESTRNIEEIFYSQIDAEQLKKLYRVYRIDFEMFGYNISPYDTYVKAAPDEKSS